MLGVLGIAVGNDGPDPIGLEVGIDAADHAAVMAGEFQVAPRTAGGACSVISQKLPTGAEIGPDKYVFTSPSTSSPVRTATSGAQLIRRPAAPRTCGA